jgi:tetratricopeptide (TPR) repeat protein
VRLWDVDRHCQIDPALPGHAGWCGPLAFSPNGKFLATTSGAEHTVYVWDVATHRRIASLAGNTDEIGGMSFSPDGRTLGTACRDDMIRLWSTASWTEVATMNDPKLDFGGTFSPDGTRLFTGEWDGGIRVWRAATPSEGDTQLSLIGYQREAVRAEQAGKWTEAVASLDWLIQAQPKEPSYHMRRGRALAQLGKWRKAAADLTQGFAGGSDDIAARIDLVRAELGAGNREGYREACTAMLDRLDVYTTEYDPSLYSEAALLGAAFPHAVANPARLVKMAEKALAFNPGNLKQQWSLGAALYRAGRPNAAVRRLSSSVTPVPRDGHLEDLLFLAMAHARLGHAGEARRWLERSQSAARQLSRQAIDPSHPVDLNLRVYLPLMLREAQQAVEKR